jgi:hypothetical protein
MDYQLIERWLVAMPPNMIAEIEPYGQCVWLSRTTRCDRYTFVGVPGREIDVLIEDGENPTSLWVCEIGRKAGKYDGTIRDRLTLRRWKQGMTDMPAGELHIMRDAWLCVEIWRDGVCQYYREYRQLRWEAHDEGVIERCVLWHANHFYTHLLGDGDGGILSVAALIRAEQPDAWKRPLASINRIVSQALYAESRRLGWRKLTRREADRLCMQSGWVRQSVVDVFYGKINENQYLEIENANQD